jgi:hypothetical protein
VHVIAGGDDAAKFDDGLPALKAAVDWAVSDKFWEGDEFQDMFKWNHAA